MASLRNAPEPSAGSQIRQRSTSGPVTVAAFLLDPLLQGELDGDRGQRLRGVVGGAGLPVPAGQAVDERPGPVPDPLAGREAVLVLDRDEHVVGVVGDLGGGDHPEPSGGSPFLATSYSSSAAMKPV